VIPAERAPEPTARTEPIQSGEPLPPKVTTPDEIAPQVTIRRTEDMTVEEYRENGRITIMFCAFEGPAMILRLYGRATIMQFDHPSFSQELAKFPGFKRARNVVFIDIERIADSCGYGVPFYEFQGPRDQLQRSVEHREQEEWERRRFESNAQSIDGLEGLTRKRTENLA
jgi:hypothetical protein